MSELPRASAPSTALQTKDTLCGICPAGCWVRVQLTDERITRVEPQPDHPLGTVCTIGEHSADIVYDPQRLQRPLRRVGPKGTFTFEEISWDQALGQLVDGLQRLKARLGPQSCAIYTGRGSFDMALCDLYQPAEVAVSSASSVLFPFGSPNTLGVGALCYVSFAMIAPHTTLGELYITMDTDVPQAELVVVWGANPATDSPPLLHEQILAARGRGAEVVVIDPRRSRTAREAGAQWIPIRPGTDGALALGLIQVLLEEELFDEAFVERWTTGFPELRQLVQHYRPEVVEGITGVAAATVRQLARRIAQARGACPVMYTGLEYSDSGVQAVRAVLILWALAGQLDVPGGLTIRMRENVFPQGRDHLLANPAPRLALGRDRFPIYSLYRGESHAIALPDAVLRDEPYPVRGLIVLGGSLITAWPDPAVWRETLGALDLLVCIDRYLTADAAYADLVLPATTLYETTSYMRYGPIFRIRERLIEPVGEARPDALILAELAHRLGYGELYPQSEEEILARALEGSGYTSAQVRVAGGWVQLPTVMMEYKKWEKGRLRADGRPGFNTPSGKLEITSSILAEHGYDALPVYTEPREGPLARPELAARYPLVFNSGTRTPYDFRSQHHGVPGLSRRLPAPLLLINPQDAGPRGIADGDQVRVETLRGEIELRAVVTEDIVQGAVDASMGGGGPLGPAAWQQANVNQLTDLQHYDPISGFPVYKALLCEVRRAASAAAGQRNSCAATDAVDPEGGGQCQAVLPQPAPPAGRTVYFDCNATSPLEAEVIAVMQQVLEQQWGNPSSIHGAGARARELVEGARRKVAEVLGCTARRVIFTSGGTEADNLAIQGLAAASRGSGRRHLIAAAVEHPAVLAPCRYLAERGYELTLLPVDRQGLVQPAALAQALRPDTLLVAVMLANNEVGTVQPVGKLCALAHQAGAFFHCDAVQALGKLPLDVEALGVDLLAVSAHKLGGPQGVGALYLRQGLRLDPLLHGGGQERGLRSGTENVAGIAGFGKACELGSRRLLSEKPQQLAALRDQLEHGLRELVPDARRNGHPQRCLPNTLNMTLPRIRGESLVLLLERQGVRCSSGSACKSGNPDPSPTLLAMGLGRDEAHCSIRLSLGPAAVPEDVEQALAAFGKILQDTASAIRFVPCR